MPEIRPIVFVTGVLLAMLSGAMLLPALVDLAAGRNDWLVFLLSAVLTLFFAISMVLATGRQGPQQLGLRQTFLLTTSSWLALAAFGALPFAFADLQLSYVDALFEAMSGLTTTGATVVIGLDTLPPGVLLWRSMLQWIGGVGIIVMGLAILPILQVGGMQLFRSESSDRSEKALPRATQLASAITGVYVTLSLLCAIGYWAAGMDAFDAVCHAMTTISTGGYSTSDASLARFDSVPVELISILFMIAGGITFSIFIQVLRGRPAVLWRDSQVRWFLGVLAAASLILTLWLWATLDISLPAALRMAAFNVVSIVTTTGFATADYNAWGPFAVVIVFALLFVGGCTGSTAGGVKVFRYAILFASLRRQVFGLTHPHAVYPQTFNGAPLPPAVTTAVMGFFFLYGLTVLAVAAGLGLMGLDFLTAFSAAATAVGNVGPGLGPIIGPAGNFYSLPAEAKLLLSAAMLFGRLEMFTVLVIFTPGFWRT